MANELKMRLARAKGFIQFARYRAVSCLPLQPACGAPTFGAPAFGAPACGAKDTLIADRWDEIKTVRTFKSGSY